MKPYPAAVVFDLDGTLIDTEGCYNDAARVMTRESGGLWGPEEDDLVVGMALDDLAAFMQGRGVEYSTGYIIERVIREVTERVADETPWRPGALTLLACLTEVGIPFGLATMAHRPTVDAILAKQEAPAFSAVVTGDAVEQGKPAPDVYLRACELLGVDPAESVGLEDSSRGLQALNAAELISIAVPLYEEILPSQANAIWEGLDGRTAESLLEVYQAQSTTPSKPFAPGSTEVLGGLLARNDVRHHNQQDNRQL